MKNKQDFYWIHGLGESDCPVANHHSCIHYTVKEDGPWQTLSHQIQDQLMALPANSQVVAYSLGGLLLLDQLIKKPELQQHLGEIQCRGVPMKGSFLASFSQSWVGQVINFCFGISKISQECPQLMGSLSAFSRPCMDLCVAVKHLSNLKNISWYCGLGRAAERFLCLGDGDGAVDGFMAHPEVVFSYFDTHQLWSGSEFHIRFALDADHTMIKVSKTMNADAEGYQCWLMPSGQVKSLIFPLSWCQIRCSNNESVMMDDVIYDPFFIPTSVLKSDVHIGFQTGEVRVVSQNRLKPVAHRPTLIIWKWQSDQSHDIL